MNQLVILIFDVVVLFHCEPEMAFRKFINGNDVYQKKKVTMINVIQNKNSTVYRVRVYVWKVDTIRNVSSENESVESKMAWLMTIRTNSGVDAMRAVDWS